MRRFFKLLDASGIPHSGSQLEFPILDNEAATVQDILGTTGLQPQHYVCLHPGARDKRRRWSIENFAFIGNHLTAKRISGMKTLLHMCTTPTILNE